MPKITEQRRRQRRTEIQAAAARCFAANGFHATSMDDIVEASGVSLGGIYRYFASKEEIIEAIAAERHFAELAVLQGSLAEPDPAEALPAVVHGFADLLADTGDSERRQLVVHLWSEALRNDTVHSTVRRGVDRPLEIIAAYLNDHADLPASVSPQAAARVMVSIALGLIAQRAWDPSVDVADYAAAAAAILTGGLAPAD